MLKLTRTMEEVEVVCLGDSRVSPRFEIGPDELATARRQCLWVRRADCDVAEDTLTVTIRGLSHSEVATLPESGDARLLAATVSGVVRMRGTGEDGSQLPARQGPHGAEVDIPTALQMLDYQPRCMLGLPILTGSTGGAKDPFFWGGSERSSGATT